MYNAQVLFHDLRMSVSRKNKVILDNWINKKSRIKIEETIVLFKTHHQIRNWINSPTTIHLLFLYLAYKSKKKRFPCRATVTEDSMPMELLITLLPGTRVLTSIVTSQLAFYVNLHRAVISPSATLTGRWRPDIDLRRMLTGIIL